MKALIGSSTLAMALLLTACGDSGGDNATGTTTAANNAPLQQVQAPNGDWTQVVSQTQDGGFVMGNPNAPVKLVEYASFGCPHCASFSEEGGPPLRDKYVKSGQVSWEFRPFMMFPTDPGMSMLLRCQGPDTFFRLAEQLYATQREWGAKAQQLSPAEQQQIQSMTPQQQMSAWVKATGVDQFLRQRGVPQAKIDSCLADEQQLQNLVNFQSNAVTRDQVGGTPTFIINGEKVDSDRWSNLEPKLREAIG